jgi:hypothetical protein
MSKFNAEQLLEQLTSEEKIALLSGANFWHTVVCCNQLFYQP